MKRLIGLAFFLCLLFTGCGQFGARIKDPVTFYYLRAQYQYSTEAGVIATSAFSARTQMTAPPPPALPSQMRLRPPSAAWTP